MLFFFPLPFVLKNEQLPAGTGAKRGEQNRVRAVRWVPEKNRLPGCPSLTSPSGFFSPLLSFAAGQKKPALAAPKAEDLHPTGATSMFTCCVLLATLLLHVCVCVCEI